MIREFPRFLIVGSCGFLVDAGTLSLCVHLLDFNPYWARIPSFAIAVTLTWYLNYKWAFEDKSNTRKIINFGRYLIVQGAGISINFFAYMASLYLSPFLFDIPELAIALASIIALLFNYFGLRRWVFKTHV